MKASELKPQQNVVKITKQTNLGSISQSNLAAPNNKSLIVQMHNIDDLSDADFHNEMKRLKNLKSSLN